MLNTAYGENAKSECIKQNADMVYPFLEKSELIRMSVSDKKHES